MTDKEAAEQIQALKDALVRLVSRAIPKKKKQ
jgi:hypothetical protein